jgi:hypothetical protein
MYFIANGHFLHGNLGGYAEFPYSDFAAAVFLYLRVTVDPLVNDISARIDWLRRKSIMANEACGRWVMSCCTSGNCETARRSWTQKNQLSCRMPA